MTKVKIVSLDEAIKILNEAHGWDPGLHDGKNVYSVKTIYNAISKKSLTRHGPPHHAQVSADEILRLFGPKRKGA